MRAGCGACPSIPGSCGAAWPASLHSQQMVLRCHRKLKACAEQRFQRGSLLPVLSPAVSHLNWSGFCFPHNDLHRFPWLQCLSPPAQPHLAGRIQPAELPPALLTPSDASPCSCWAVTHHRFVLSSVGPSLLQSTAKCHQHGGFSQCPVTLHSCGLALPPLLLAK